MAGQHLQSRQAASGIHGTIGFCLQEAETRQLKQDNLLLRQQLRRQQCQVHSCYSAYSLLSEMLQQKLVFMQSPYPVSLYLSTISFLLVHVCWQTFHTCDWQVTDLEPSRVGNKQSSSTQRSFTDTGGAPDFAEGDMSAEQLLGVMKQVLQSLQKCKPAELGDIPSADDPKAKHMEELLLALKPQLQGDNIIEWLDASSQLKEPLQELIMTQAALDHASTESEVLKQSCLTTSEGLITQLGKLCDSWHGWLISIDKYERRARDVLQLQHRGRVCAQAEQVIRPK